MKGVETMKFMNRLITMLAVVGIVILISAVGTCDYMVEIGKDYPLYKTLIQFLIGFACITPAFIRGKM